MGHKQHLTVLRITEILTDGKKPAKRAAAKVEEQAGRGAERRNHGDAGRREAEAAAKKPAAKKPAAKKPAARKPAAKKSKE